MLSGFALSLAFAPADLGFLAWIAMVPAILALRGASMRTGLLSGAAFGLAFFGVLVGWISLVGWIAWGGLVALQTAFIAAFGLFAAPLSRGGPLARLLGLPMLFTGIELARTRYPLGGFGFGTLGSTQHGGLPMLPLARLGGVFAITFAIIAVNALIAEAIGARRRTARVIWVTVAIALIAGPAFLPLGAPGTGRTLDVALIQGNVPRGFFTGLRRGREGPEDKIIIDNHLALTQTLSDDPPDLIVWPENSLDRDPFVDRDAQNAVARVLAETQTPLLVGAILDGPRPDTFYNANLLFEPDGTLAGRYDKNHLVPFGEYVPWAWARDVVPALSQVPSDGIPGDGASVLRSASLPPIGAVICFESAYPDHVRSFVEAGAEMIVVTTNNATFQRSALARMHTAQSQMRAVEMGRPVLHAAIAGVSAVIRADGKILQTAGLFLPAVVRQQVQTSDGLTPFAEYGDVIELSYAAAAALAALVSLLIAMRRKIPGISLDDEADEFWDAAGDPIDAERLRTIESGLLRGGEEFSGESAADPSDVQRVGIDPRRGEQGAGIDAGP